MSDTSDIYLPNTLYEDELDEDTILDLSSQNLTTVPEIKKGYLNVLYLQNNKLKTLPEDFFLCLPHLKWLDLRENELIDIPLSVKNHRSLSHILLQNNKIISLPHELGTVTSIKVIQLSGNPIIYPGKDVIGAGTEGVMRYLREKYIEDTFEDEKSVSDMVGSSDYLDKLGLGGRSYNSVIDGPKIFKHKTLSVQFSERDFVDESDDLYSSSKKCPKLAKSRSRTLPPFCQSAKYVRPLMACPRTVQDEKIKKNCLMEAALKRKKSLITKRDKALQGIRNIELLKNWRKNYKKQQLTLSLENNKYKLTPKNYPYDTNPEYMALLTREDIGKDLPDKYKKKLYRRSKPTVPRKSNNDVHLAMKIKKLFENLEAIDLNRDTMSPRTEQRVLLGEIQKISEIKQKLMELSSTNTISVPVD